jgi:peptide/nickel transport system substrate-binding protein
MQAVAGAVPSLIKTDVGIFVPGTPLASRVGVESTRGPKDLNKLKQDLIAAGYKGEKIVVLAATTIPIIWEEAQVASDVLAKIGFNVDFQALDWVTVVSRRASKETIDKGGWNIFYTYLGGFGNISPAPNVAIRGNGLSAWFGWPTNPKLEALYDGWFEAPDIAAQRKIIDEMQAVFAQDPPYAPMGMFDQPTAFHRYMQDVRDGWPQFYGLKKAI